MPPADHVTRDRGARDGWAAGEAHVRLLPDDLEGMDALERRPPAGATTMSGEIVSLEWHRRWPCEGAWKARKRT